MFVLLVSIFGEPITRTAGDLFSVPAACTADPLDSLPDSNGSSDHTTRGSGSHIVHAGSHKTHYHGIAVEMAPFFIADFGLLIADF